ncbi:MAG: hypothetical protein Q4D54_10620 [Eubacteriales bacterium]|nr:hypothetical protein [Lachnospiraceae bacterium]MDO5128178.1 hypothetical protein [Eubacteriales bacterium]
MATQLKRKPYIKNRRAYRRAMMYINIFFVCFIAVFIVVGFFFTFTGKRSEHDKGVVNYYAGEYEDAIYHFRKSVEREQWFSDKLDIDSYMYCADCYMQLGDFLSAKQMYLIIDDQFSKKKYDEVELQKCIRMTDALIAFSDGDYSVVNELNKAIANGHPEINLYAAVCYEKAGDYASMYSCYKAYEKEFGKNAYLCNRYATYYMSQRDYKWALEYINEGISYNEEAYMDELLRARIDCLSKLGNYDEAYSYSVEYVETHPDDEESKELMKFLATRVVVDETTVYDLYYGVPGSNNENKGNVSEE